jgi:hypothetical protein
MMGTSFGLSAIEMDLNGEKVDDKETSKCACES